MRIMQWGMVGLSFFCLGISFYFQYAYGWQPCSLCWMQRLCMGLIGLSALWGACTRRRWGYGFWGVQWTFIAAGLWFAGRQVWLQSLPPDAMVACMPGLDTLIAYFSWLDVLRALWWGSVSCVHDQQQWLGLSLPKWGLLYFTGMGLLLGATQKTMRTH